MRMFLDIEETKNINLPNPIGWCKYFTNCQVRMLDKNYCKIFIPRIINKQCLETKNDTWHKSCMELWIILLEV